MATELSDLLVEADACSVDQYTLRQRLGRRDWWPAVAYGPSGWVVDDRASDRRVIVSTATVVADGREWTHASISRSSGMPSYDDLAHLFRAVWSGAGHAYQVFVPPGEHVNYHAHALHLWGLADGGRVLPDFAPLGMV